METTVSHILDIVLLQFVLREQREIDSLEKLNSPGKIFLCEGQGDHSHLRSVL